MEFPLTSGKGMRTIHGLNDEESAIPKSKEIDAMPVATLTSKGQLTVPKQVRARLGLHEGDKVDFRIEGDKLATIRPATLKVSEVFGMLAPHNRRKKAATIEEMNRAVAEAFRKKLV